MNYLDVRLGDHFACQFIGISFTVDHSGNAGVDEHLCADDAGHCGAVQGGAIDIGAMLGGLNDGVLLGVQATAELVPLPGRYSEPLAQATRTSYPTLAIRSILMLAVAVNSLSALEELSIDMIRFWDIII